VLLRARVLGKHTDRPDKVLGLRVRAPVPAIGDGGVHQRRARDVLEDRGLALGLPLTEIGLRRDAVLEAVGRRAAEADFAATDRRQEQARDEVLVARRVALAAAAVGDAV